MMHPSLDKLKTHQEVAFETTSLHSEGYHLICEHEFGDLIYCKMRHRYNGNVIDILGYPQERKVILKKNRKVIKSRTW